jgi:hypothetical protein
MTDQTLLLRQVNPSWIQAGRVTSQAFKPTPKDDKRLSAYDGDQIQPDASWSHYTQVLGFSSVGVLAVIVEECRSLELPVEPDPAPFPEHVIINFDGCSGTVIEKRAKVLKRYADSRGWQYQAES